MNQSVLPLINRLINQLIKIEAKSITQSIKHQCSKEKKVTRKQASKRKQTKIDTENIYKEKEAKRHFSILQST